MCDFRAAAEAGWFYVQARAFADFLLAHTGMDRAVGYGLKYPTGFSDTHLGRIGRAGR